MNILRPPLVLPIVRNIRNRGLLLLTLATLFYLIWQMSLSGAILTATTEEQSRRLSDLARWTVGFGTALLTVRIGLCQRRSPAAGGHSGFGAGLRGHPA